MEPIKAQALKPATIYTLALTTQALLMDGSIDRRGLGRQLADVLADVANQAGLTAIDGVRIPRSLKGRVEVARAMCRLIAAGTVGLRFEMVDRLRDVGAAMRGEQAESS
jgi:hypothetical protein